MKRLIAVMCALAALCVTAGAWEKDKLSLNMYWNFEIGSHLNKPDKLNKFYNSLTFKGDFDFTKDVTLFFNLKKFYDSVYDITGEYKNGSSKTATNTGNLWLRELFLDAKLDPVFMRLGRQQVVWGTADGVRILDCINPSDNRYAQLDDAGEYRIPLWMMRFDVNMLTNGSLQLLAIPDYEPNFNSGPGDVFVYNVARRRTPPNFTTYDRQPQDGFDDATYAVRWQHVVNGWEYTLNYKYGREFYPAVTVTPIPPFPPTRFNLVKEYKREHVIGGSFSKAVNFGKLSGLTFRGEVAYTKDKPFPIGTDGNPNYAAGPVAMNTYTYMLGFDKYFFTKLLISGQFIQFLNPADRYGTQLVLHPATLGAQDKVETLGTLKVSYDFLNQRLKPEMLVVYDNSNDWRISPKISYEVNDNLWVYAGIHYFTGKGYSLYGEFEPQGSMVYSGLQLSF